MAVDTTVPAGTPGLFDCERWDPGTKNDGGELQWAFPVQSGQEVVVRLFLANRCGCTSGAGQRRFDVRSKGSTVLDELRHRRRDVGHQRGTMRTFTVTSDGTVNLGFGHELENPLFNAVEIAAGRARCRRSSPRSGGATSPAPRPATWCR